MKSSSPPLVFSLFAHSLLIKLTLLPTDLFNSQISPKTRKKTNTMRTAKVSQFPKRNTLSRIEHEAVNDLLLFGTKKKTLQLPKSSDFTLILSYDFGFLGENLLVSLLIFTAITLILNGLFRNYYIFQTA